MEKKRQHSISFPQQTEWKYSDESDANLVVIMSMVDDDPDTACAAFTEFYQRHVKYLYAVCLRAYDDLLSGDSGVDDLVMETFQKAYQKIHLLKLDDISDPDRIRQRIRAWLGKIAQRLFVDILRKRKLFETVELDSEIWYQIPSPDKVEDLTGKLIKQVQDAINQLSEKEQIVIRVTFQWYRPGQNHQRLPNDVVEDLAETLQTTPENLRQIRRRALIKIREILKETGALKRNKALTTEK